ncbi:MAG: 3-oxoacyl-ACP reductase FabG [Roseovarius sp.]|nr:3-oxoacyl-ACP reductase FabG [Roseovarius sp.]
MPETRPRVVVVTGASGGIGAATAREFAQYGDHVVLADLTPDRAQDHAAAISEQTGTKAIAVACDVTKSKSVEAMMQAAVDSFGSVDVLVNNAGITRDNLLFKLEEDEWDDVINVHLKGAYLCTRAAQSHMVRQQYGKIVNLSSTSALGNRGQANYSTAKAGLQGLTRTLAIELGPFNINVNAVAPGFVDSEMTRAVATRLGKDPEAHKAERAAKIPVRRVGQPEDIAALVHFLCSDKASYVSGQIIYACGGPESRR